MRSIGVCGGHAEDKGQHVAASPCGPQAVVVGDAWHHAVCGHSVPVLQQTLAGQKHALGGLPEAVGNL